MTRFIAFLIAFGPLVVGMYRFTLVEASFFNLGIVFFGVALALSWVMAK